MFNYLFLRMYLRMAFCVAAHFYLSSINLSTPTNRGLSETILRVDRLSPSSRFYVTKGWKTLRKMNPSTLRRVFTSISL